MATLFLAFLKSQRSQKDAKESSIFMYDFFPIWNLPSEADWIELNFIGERI